MGNVLFEITDVRTGSGESYPAVVLFELGRFHQPLVILDYWELSKLLEKISDHEKMGAMVRAELRPNWIAPEEAERFVESYLENHPGIAAKFREPLKMFHIINRSDERDQAGSILVFAASQAKARARLKDAGIDGWENIPLTEQYAHDVINICPADYRVTFGPGLRERVLGVLRAFARHLEGKPSTDVYDVNRLIWEKLGKGDLGICQ